MVMCRSIQSVLVVVCVVTLSHHIQLGKSQNDGKLVCKNNIMLRILELAIYYVGCTYYFCSYKDC